MRNKNNMINLKNNIPKDYFFNFLFGLDLTRGVWMIYLASKGMNLIALGFLETLFHITSFTMEVPTGAIADIYGRKASRILGRFLSVISVFLILFSDHLIGYSIAFIITALSYNMESGAGEALVYDSLKCIGKEKTFMKVRGNNEMFMQAASVLSFLIGGYLATKSYTLTYIITGVIGTVALIQAFTFTEPPTEEETKEKKPNFKTQFKDSLDILRGNSRLTFLILFSQFIFSFTTTIFFYLQNYMKNDGYSEFSIGAVYSIAAIIGGVLAPNVHKIEKIIKEKGILIYMPILLSISTWGIALFKYPFLFYFPIVVAEGMIFVAFGDYINRLIPSDKRATLLSMSSMVFSFFMITLFPLVGFLGETISLRGAFMTLAAISTVFTLVNTRILFKSK